MSDAEETADDSTKSKTLARPAKNGQARRTFRVIVFNSMESMDAFLKYFEFDPLTRYLDGEILKSNIGMDADE